MANTERPGKFRIALGDKGRLVLPAALRKACGLQAGDRLLARLEPDGSIRLLKAEDPVAFFQGRFKGLSGGRPVVDDLIAERREEARREEREP
ncbi:MAG: AbrB/MazE/SpoVT family DNA-binding domain-containing protein [Candidatus Sericytochromatia bacterium]|nr:AbrB/MazE/SpoVT family DNA-binding domain-containing protein [Candidatus Tanganyikabacteria bacterium]